MTELRKFFLLLVAFACLAPGVSRAEVIVAFYSHELGTSFPHAFIKLEGTLQQGGTPVDDNFGFTAKSVTPAVLMGAVGGKIEKVAAKYIASSDRQFAIRISDAQYAALQELIEKWRKLPGKSYSLNSRNCIHFVGNVAQLIGLKVVFDQKLMKKPRSFLLSLAALNPWVIGK